MDTEEEARLAAEAAAKKAADDAAAEVARKAAEEAAKTGDNKPSDAEAKLLKETMKFKKDAQAAQAALEAANAKLKDFDGLDPAELRKLIADKAEAERLEMEKRGEYDRILAQVRADAESRVSSVAAEKSELQKKLDASQKRIDDLVIGGAFSASKFLSENTVLSGDKARRLYGEHFEIEDGNLVGYDKPKGAGERTPLVDPTTGTKLGFDAAIEKILKADPDFVSIAKSQLKPGSNSGTANAGKVTRPASQQQSNLYGRRGLSQALKAQGPKLVPKVR